MEMQMDMYQGATQSEAALFPVTASASKMTARGDSSWRSAVLQGFDAIHLSEMDPVALLRRTDTKYLLSEEQVSQALARLTDRYWILEIDGRRLHRYRTDPIPVREMTYLFVLMALPVIDAVLLSQSAYLALLIANGVTVLALYIGESEWGCRYVQRKSVTYEKIDLIKPENYDRLLADLRERTGLAVTRCEVGRIDFLRDVAELKIYYQQDPARLPRRLSLTERVRSRFPLAGACVNEEVANNRQGRSS
jgi:hypothetical protein